MIEFGLLGKSLSHSFSKNYFEEKFSKLKLSNYTYHNFEIDKAEDLNKIISEYPNLKGLNVTIPYKETVICLLDSVTEESKEIGAVNCIKINAGKLIGYNTDAYGFSQSIKPFLDNNHERALILGTGGASKAVAYSLKKLGVEYYFVTQNEKKAANYFQYSEINEHVMNAFKLVVNTTPLGTFPNVTECPALPYQYFSAQHLAYDLVYNPAQTQFLKKAAEKGAIAVNGLSMLQLQAEKSWEIWMKA